MLPSSLRPAHPGRSPGRPQRPELSWLGGWVGPATGAPFVWTRPGDAWPVGGSPGCLQLRGQRGLTADESPGEPDGPGSLCAGQGRPGSPAGHAANPAPTSECDEKLCGVRKGGDSLACPHDCGPCLGSISPSSLSLHLLTLPRGCTQGRPER